MDDRRRYFRIHDNVSLKYRIVQDSDIEDEMIRNEHNKKDIAELKAAFNCIDTKIMTKMDRLKEVNPLIAEILGLYDKKISLIQSMNMHLDEPDENTLTEAQQVNLSASGMSFESNTPINEGANLKVEMVLFPEYHFIPVYARVIDCRKKVDDNLYRFSIAVDFIGINEKDQETIMQHILSKQAKQLKNERNEQTTETHKKKAVANG